MPEELSREFLDAAGRLYAIAGVLLGPLNWWIMVAPSSFGPELLLRATADQPGRGRLSWSLAITSAMVANGDPLDRHVRQLRDRIRRDTGMR